jgi:hypothetical protein
LRRSKYVRPAFAWPMASARALSGSRALQQSILKEAVGSGNKATKLLPNVAAISAAGWLQFLVLSSWKVHHVDSANAWSI